MTMTTIVWITAGVALTGALVINLISRIRMGAGTDHGWVSAHWIAEHRAGEQGDRLR
jgi:hypothetical protein